jgi:hypothetical protein
MKNMNYAKRNLSVYLPSLISITENLDMNWNHINNLVNEKHEDRKAELKENNQETMQVSGNVYDIIVEAMKGNPQANRYLDFMVCVFHDLYLILKDEDKIKIKPTIENFLINLDYKYLNFLGEMAVLNNLLKSKIYTLNSIEVALENKPDSKTIDFGLTKVEDRSLVFVEIVNIHPDEERIENDDEKIRTFLYGRFVNKINDKKKKLVDKSKANFFLVPVIWGNTETLKIYSDYFKRNKIEIDKVTEPVVYSTFVNESTGYYEHRFANISNLFKSYP